jgi:hypothetical protein
MGVVERRWERYNLRVVGLKGWEPFNKEIQA